MKMRWEFIVTPLQGGTAVRTARASTFTISSPEMGMGAGAGGPKPRLAWTLRDKNRISGHSAQM